MIHFNLKLLPKPYFINISIIYLNLLPCDLYEFDCREKNNNLSTKKHVTTIL